MGLTPTLNDKTALAGPSDVGAWFRDTKQQVREDVEVLQGLDQRPLLFIKTTGKYVAVGFDLPKLLPLFDGTRTGAEIIEQIASRADPILAMDRLGGILHELRQAGALVEAPKPEHGRRGIASFMRREHLLRLPLTRSIGTWLEGPVAPLRAIPGRVLAGLWVTMSAIGFAVGLFSLFTAGSGWQLPSNLWVLYLVLFLQIGFHELSHALVCQYLKVPAREAGVGLMLYVMPVGYVDRTDSYRITDRKSRAFLSLAGPINDQIWFGVTGLVVLLAPPEISHLAFSMLALQVLLTLMNFNPLVPSDGYHAVSALAGIVNFRGKALNYLTHKLLRVPLSESQLTVSRKTSRAYIWYGIGCLAFVLVLVLGMARTVGRLLEVLA